MKEKGELRKKIKVEPRHIVAYYENIAAQKDLEYAQRDLFNATELALVKNNQVLRLLIHEFENLFSCDIPVEDLENRSREVLRLLIENGIGSVHESYKIQFNNLAVDLLNIKQLELIVSRAQQNHNYRQRQFIISSEIVGAIRDVEEKKTISHYLPNRKRIAEEIIEILTVSSDLADENSRFPYLNNDFFYEGRSVSTLYDMINTDFISECNGKKFAEIHSFAESYWIKFETNIESFVAYKALSKLDETERESVKKFLTLRNNPNTQVIASIFSNIFFKIKNGGSSVSSFLESLRKLSYADDNLYLIYDQFRNSIWPLQQKSEFQQIFEFLESLCKLNTLRLQDQELIALEEQMLNWIRAAFSDGNLTTYFESNEEDLDIVFYIKRLSREIEPLFDKSILYTIEQKIQSEIKLTIRSLVPQIEYAHAIFKRKNTNNRDAIWGYFFPDNRSNSILPNPELSDTRAIASSAIEVPLFFLASYLKTLFNRGDFSFFE